MASAIFGAVVVVLLIGGLVWFFVLDEDDAGGVTTAPDDLTAETMMTALLTAEVVGDEFREAYRGSARSGVDHVVASEECQTAYAALQSLPSDVEVVFEDPEERSVVQHFVGPVGADDPDLEAVADGLGACSEMTLVYENGMEVEGRMDAEVLGGPGEAAMALTLSGESAEGSSLGFTGRIEVYGILWARGGVYSRVTVTNGVIEDEQGGMHRQGTADRALAVRMAEAADERIRAGMG